MSIFKPASKAQSYLRLAIFGPSGSGKTMTSLRVATGIGGRIAVIDTERGSASLYADRYPFDVVELGDDQSIDRTIATLKAAREAGYEVVIIDSLSHAWKELLDEVDKLAATKYGRNTFAAWSEGTPKQKRMVDAILSYPGHVIATMRSKTEWVIDDSKGKGRGTPVRVGMAPEQGKGIEYEFTLLMEMSVENIGHVTKDRTGKFHGKMIDKPGEDFGAELRDWLGTGDTPPVVPDMPADDPVQTWQVKALQGIIEEVAFGMDAAGKARARNFIAFAAGLPRVDNVLGLTEPEASFALNKWGSGSGTAYRVDPGKLAVSLQRFYEHEDLQRSIEANGEPPAAAPEPEPAAEAPELEAVDPDPTPEPAEAASTEQASLLPDFDPNARPSRTRKAMQPIGEDETAEALA